MPRCGVTPQSMVLLLSKAWCYMVQSMVLHGAEHGATSVQSTLSGLCQCVIRRWTQRRSLHNYTFVAQEAMVPTHGPCLLGGEGEICTGLYPRKNCRVKGTIE